MDLNPRRSAAGESDEDFDEAWYLAKYPDVAVAVARGDWKSGYAHWIRVGQSAGRIGSAPREIARIQESSSPRPATSSRPATSRQTDASEAAIAPVAPQLEIFDSDYYGQCYPLAADEIARGMAVDLDDHYRKLGRSRGYLPNSHAPRPENPADWRSRFGGFWTDQANALDLVAAKLDLGVISENQALLLCRLIEDGYVVLKGAIPSEILDRAEAEFDRAYAGEVAEVQFNVTGIGRKITWQPEVLTQPAKALDLHWLSSAIRDLIFADEILKFLHLVLERRAFATQTLSFWRGSAQGAHQDSAYVNYSHPMQFLATWIALEDVSENCGELFYYIGSQRIPEYLYLERYKGIEEAARMNAGAKFEGNPEARIPPAAATLGLRHERFLAKRGDVLIWSADLAHGGSPISHDTTRKSVVTHYCTAEAVPSYFENRPGKKTIKQHGRAYYASAHYKLEP
jgi:phytanoyl-CoA hydroxylase